MKKKSLIVLALSTLLLTSCDTIAKLGTYTIKGEGEAPEEPGTYRVIFHPNGGSEVKTLRLKEGYYIDLSECITTRDDHEFICWCVDDKLTDRNIPEIMGNHSLDLYALWTMDFDAPHFYMGRYPTKYVPEEEIKKNGKYKVLDRNNHEFVTEDGKTIPENSVNVYFDADYLTWNVTKDAANNRYLLTLDNTVNYNLAIPTLNPEEEGPYYIDNDRWHENVIFSEVERKHIFSISHPVPQYSMVKDLSFKGQTDYSKAIGLSDEDSKNMLVLDGEDYKVFNTKTKELSPLVDTGEDQYYGFNPVIRFMTNGSTFNIKYDPTSGTMSISSQIVPYEERTNVETPGPVNDDYSFDDKGIPSATHFAYWEDRLTHQRYGYIIEEVTDDLDLFANYYTEPFKQEVKIKYHLGYAEATNDPSNPDKYEIGKKLYINSPTCAGETFEGWYYDKEFTQYAGKNVIEVFGAYHKPDYSGIDLYAKWESSVCLIYYTSEVVMKNNPNNPIHYIHNSTTPIPLYAPNIQDSYRFSGWYYEGKKVTEITPEMMKNDGVSLTAHWDLVLSSETFYIDYYFGGDDVICLNEGSYTTSYKLATSSITYPSLTREGYTLKGWSLDGKTIVKTAAAVLCNYDNVVLTAIWEEVTE